MTAAAPVRGPAPGSPPPGGSPSSGPARPGPARRRWGRRAVAVALLVVVVVYGVLPLLGDVPEVLEGARAMSPWWFLPGLVLEAASITAYGCFTRSLLAPGGRPPLSRLVRVDLTTWGAGHVLPGGPAGVAALRFRMLRDEGVDEPGAALLAGVQGVASALVLHAMLWVALAAVALVPGGAPAGTGVGAALLGIVDLAAVAVVVLRPGGRVARRVRRLVALVPGVDADRLHRDVREMVRLLRRLVRDPRRAAVAVGFAAVNWALDGLALLVFVALLAGPVDALAVLVGFGLASALAVLPITPGGVGIVEGVLVPLLVAAGVPAAPALVAVLAWRVVGYWLPIPAAALAWLSLRVGRPGSR